MTGAGVHVWSAFGAAGPPAESEASPLIYPFYDIFTTIGATTAPVKWLVSPPLSSPGNVAAFPATATRLRVSHERSLSGPTPSHQANAVAANPPSCKCHATGYQDGRRFSRDNPSGRFTTASLRPMPDQHIRINPAGKCPPEGVGGRLPINCAPFSHTSGMSTLYFQRLGFGPPGQVCTYPLNDRHNARI